MIDLRQGDCLKVLKSIPSESIDCIVTSPPYNKGYWSSNRNINNGFHTKSRRIEYGDFDDNINPTEYEKQQKEVIKECLRVLKPTGSLFYNHIDILNKHQTIHPKWVYDFPLKQIIIWNRKNTPKLDKSYFFPITEYIFWIQKDKNARTKFNRKNSLFNKNVWNINPDKNNNFPAPFPVDLALNCILSTTDKEDVVLDPYMGSGTTGVACVNSDRNFIGIELDTECFNVSKKRIESAKTSPTTHESNSVE